MYFKNKNKRQKWEAEQLRLEEKAKFEKLQIEIQNKILEEKCKSQETRNTLLEKDVNSFAFLKNVLKTIIEMNNSVDQKLETLQKEYRVKVKPAIFLETEQMVSEMQETIKGRLLDIAKQYFDEKIISALNDRNILYITLRSIGFGESEISSLADFSTLSLSTYHHLKYTIRKIKDYLIMK